MSSGAHTQQYVHYGGLLWLPFSANERKLMSACINVNHTNVMSVYILVISKLSRKRDVVVKETQRNYAIFK